MPANVPLVLFITQGLPPVALPIVDCGDCAIWETQAPFDGDFFPFGWAFIYAGIAKCGY